MNDHMNRHERRRLRTRKKLQEAATNLLLEKGYDSITIQEITDSADLGRGTFYIHFKDKEDIIWSVIEETIVEEDRQAFQRIIEFGMPDRPFFEGLKNMFNHAAANRNLYRAILSSHGSLVFTNRIHNMLAADLYKEIQIPELDPHYGIPYEVAAQALTAALLRTVIWWLNHENNYDVDEMAEMLCQMFYPHRS